VIVEWLKEQTQRLAIVGHGATARMDTVVFAMSNDL
jgi:hypothetical protein